jgi:hypothetical protein
MRNLLGRRDPDTGEQEYRRLVEALAHAKAKIRRLQDQLADDRRDRAPISHKPREARPSAVGFDVATSAKRAAVAALADGLAASADVWPGLAAAASTSPARGLPLRVAVASPEPTPLDHVRDPRLLVGRLDEVEEPDILVIPRGENWREVSSAVKRTPDHILDRAARGQVRIVLDASREGAVHKGVRSDLIHNLLQERAISPRHVLYMTQDRSYGDDYRRYCERGGLVPMEVRVYDYFVQSLFLSLEQDGERLFEEGLARRLELGPKRDRRFLSMNFNPRPTKVLFLLRLIKDGLWEQGWISFAGFEWMRGRGVTADDMAAAMLALPGFEEMARDCIGLMAELERAGPQVLGAPSGTDPRSVDRLGQVELEEYRQSWFSVVSETEMRPRLHRITEKPFKPLLNFHPILVLGGPGSLKLIRAYGFETFEGLFDETYDEEEEPRTRFEMVYGELLRFCRMEEPELARRISEVEDRVLYNARWGLVELPIVFRRRIDVEMVSGLIDFASGRGG